MKAKSISKWSKIAAIVWVVGFFLLNAIMHLGVQTKDIIYVGLFIAVSMGPIDFSIWLDKLKEIALIHKGLKE